MPKKIVLSYLLLLGRSAYAYARPDLLDSYVFYFETPFRADSLLAGVLLAVLCETPAFRTKWVDRMAGPLPFLVGLAALLVGLVWRDPLFREAYRYSLLSVGAVLILASVVFSERLRPIQAILNSRILVFIGKLSYSIYVWHLIVPTIFDLKGISASPLVRVATSLAGALLAAWISYRFVEMPFMSLRSRFGSRRTPRQDAGAPYPFPNQPC